MTNSKLGVGRRICSTKQVAHQRIEHLIGVSHLRNACVFKFSRIRIKEDVVFFLYLRIAPVLIDRRSPTI